MKKVFDSEYSAKEFAKKVNGTVEQKTLPNYLSVDIIYVVVFDESEGGEDGEK